jgi:hypothetical protein
MPLAWILEAAPAPAASSSTQPCWPVAGGRSGIPHNKEERRKPCMAGGSVCGKSGSNSLQTIRGLVQLARLAGQERIIANRPIFGLVTRPHRLFTTAFANTSLKSIYSEINSHCSIDGWIAWEERRCEHSHQAARLCSYSGPRNILLMRSPRILSRKRHIQQCSYIPSSQIFETTLYCSAVSS